jgi:hypothetical protein
MDFRFDLALGCECNCFCQVFTAPTMEPRIVMRFMTTSKMGVRNSPGGRPTRLMVPFRRTILSACANAGGETAVTSTPWARRRFA